MNRIQEEILGELTRFFARDKENLTPIQVIYRAFDLTKPYNSYDKATNSDILHALKVLNERK